MSIFKRLALIGFIILSCVGCDQVTKSIAVKALSQQTEAITYLNGFVRLQYAENTGAFLGFGSLIPEVLRFWIFTVAVSLILLVGLAWLIRSKKLPLLMTAALSLVVAGGMGTLVVAGGMGNAIDRIFNDGRVVDFLNLGIGSLRTGIFNVADIAITFGALALLALSFRQQRRDTP